MIRVLRDFAAGVRVLGLGFGLVFRSPRLLVIGAIPAVITTVLMIAGFVWLATSVDSLAAWATPFADDWNEGLRATVRFAAGFAAIGGFVALGLLLFTAITLIVGGPFYEHIAETVEDTELGGVPEAERVSWGRSAFIGLRDGILLVGLAVLCAIPLFLAGFIPIVGQTVVPVVAVLVNASLLAIELTAIPFTRRGIDLGERRRVLRKRRAVTLGFAAPAYLLCLIPLAALVVMPAAMAGGTVLAHRLLHDRVR
ncbi:EI24 domain-containing protein [Actinosynnema sp. NPDC020468]|uniref:EI24 domain-containing protein n=1 Tax=Actinosynnema sp. NPDC020468 TaxID=3154488 RepID=UPI0033F5A44F